MYQAVAVCKQDSDAARHVLGKTRSDSPGRDSWQCTVSFTLPCSVPRQEGKEQGIAPACLPAAKGAGAYIFFSFESDPRVYAPYDFECKSV
ncbi:protein of unknown function [Alcaligenes faecalis subsp. faecalis]|nr:protein of unknown function [Alcaligenes faecalis subsp. faecalis]